MTQRIGDADLEKYYFGAAKTEHEALLCDDLRAARAEIKTLRAALREIDGIVNWRESIPFTDLHRIARAALEGK